MSTYFLFNQTLCQNCFVGDTDISSIHTSKVQSAYIFSMPVLKGAQLEAPCIYCVCSKDTRCKIDFCMCRLEIKRLQCVCARAKAIIQTDKGSFHLHCICSCQWSPCQLRATLTAGWAHQWRRKTRKSHQHQKNKQVQVRSWPSHADTFVAKLLCLF